MVAFPMAVTERTQNRAISIFSYLAGKATPRRPADFTGVFYAPEYPLDGLGSVSFLQISWIRPSRDMSVSLTQNPPCTEGCTTDRGMAVLTKHGCSMAVLTIRAAEAGAPKI